MARNFKWDSFGDFQTLWSTRSFLISLSWFLCNCIFITSAFFSTQSGSTSLLVSDRDMFFSAMLSNLIAVICENLFCVVLYVDNIFWVDDLACLSLICLGDHFSCSMHILACQKKADGWSYAFFFCLTRFVTNVLV